MNPKQLLTAIFLLSVFISCNKSGKENEVAKTEFMQQEAGSQDQNEQQVQGLIQTEATDSSATLPPVMKQHADPDWDKKIIKTATLKLEVPDFKKYNEKVRNTIKQYGGYIAQEDQNLTEEKSENTLSIKVPVAQFETMMNQLPCSDVKVLERKIITDDVTGEVVDIRSRLEAKKQMRLKYLDFLKQSKNMEEVLQVQKEINEIQEQIESATGRVNYLTKQAAYSTINLCFFQPMPGFIPDGNKPAFFTRLADAFRSGVDWFADLFIGLIFMWPFFVIAIIILILWKRYRAVKPIRQNV